MKRVYYQLRRVGLAGELLCVDGKFHPASECGFGGIAPRLYKSPAGAAAKQRALPNATTVEPVTV